ncbi:transcriptional regulator [Bifidobacterium amazonense]|uniref:Transcriptional regulator n=1 Tax=Bifidobacterium amazonense TaxID=2809027 RepID=A0ABS9VWI7_9BIFI|nr:transcriptional regulator [Bifidobacterium amazonense]MCH9276477.1 transcriptional regulator [Bifidobacterium amazonense]
MDLLFVTSSTALGSAVARTLESAGHMVDVASDGQQLDEAFGAGDAGRTDGTGGNDGNDDARETGDVRRVDADPQAAQHASRSARFYDAVLLDDLADPRLMERLERLLRTRNARNAPSGDGDRAADDGRPLPRIALLATPSMPRGREQASRYGIDDPSSVLHPAVTVNKPFSDAELLSYIELLSPGHADADGPALLIHGDLTLDTRAQRAYYRSTSRPIALSPREYSALEALIRADGRFLSFDDLSRLVFGEGVGFVEQRAVMATTLYSLTRKMRRLGFFITQRGQEYRIR